MAEETIVELAPMRTEELVSEQIEKADLMFLKPVAPELRTVSDQELRLE